MPMPKRLQTTSPDQLDPARRPIVNQRFFRWVYEHVSWEQVLVTCGYEVVDRRVLHIMDKGMAARGSRFNVHNDFYVHCIYHPERTASLHMTPKGFQCFGCGMTGGRVRFVIDAMQLRTHKAVKQFFAAAASVCME